MLRGRDGERGYAVFTQDFHAAVEQRKAAFIADIYVQESARRHGHGRALYKAIVDWCALNDLQTLELEVAAHNPAGRAFWQAMGGRELMVRMRAKVNTDDGNDETLSDG
ncbi:MAG: GNAT family N-acetyltransferase [Chloroflexota bacterium]